jgi:hypothetical protein
MKIKCQTCGKRDTNCLYVISVLTEKNLVYFHKFICRNCANELDHAYLYKNRRYLIPKTYYDSLPPLIKPQFKLIDWPELID